MSAMISNQGDTCARDRLVTAVRAGELTSEQRERLVTLLYRIDTAVTVAPMGAEHYPDDPEQAAYYVAAAWEPVGRLYRRLLAQVSDVA